MVIEQLLKEFIIEMRKLRVVDYGAIDQQRKELAQDSVVEPSERAPSQTTAQVNDRLSQDEANSLENRALDLMDEPQCADVEAYIDYALEYEPEDEGDDPFTFDAATLQAISRNMTLKANPWLPKNALAHPNIIAHVKKTLLDAGFKRKERPKLDRFRRGPRSNPHGAHPFAHQGGGGSGMGSDRSGQIAFGYGGGPGAIGGETPWKADDSKNLPMGSRRR